MTFVSTLGQALDQIERIKVTQLQLSTMQTQVATGKKTQLFMGLGTDIIASERAREGITRLDNYINNIDIADRRIKMMINAMTNIKKQAESVLNALEIQTQQGEYEIESVGNLARNTANFLREIVNMQDGDRYLFGGAETTTPPLSHTGSLDTYILKQLGNWAAPAVPGDQISTDQLIDSYRNSSAMTDTIMGYSPPLAAGTAKSVTVRVENFTEIDYTVFANTQGIRDIIAGVNMVANIDRVIDEVTLDPDDPVPPGTITAPGATKQEQNDNFYKFFNDVAAMMNQALDKLDSELYSLSQSHAQLDKIKETHKLDKNIFAEIVSDVEDIDMNEVAVKLNALQIQLEATYRVTATVSTLSLVNFLGP